MSPFSALPTLGNHPPISTIGSTTMVPLALESPSLYLAAAPEHRSSDAGPVGMPKGGREMLPVSEKVSTAQ